MYGDSSQDGATTESQTKKILKWLSDKTYTKKLSKLFGKTQMVAQNNRIIPR